MDCVPGAGACEATCMFTRQVFKHGPGWVLTAEILSADVAKEGPKSAETLCWPALCMGGSGQPFSDNVSADSL